MTGRIAIVTGGTTGIGLACATALIASGHRVAIGARGAPQADLTGRLGPNAMFSTLDVANRASVDGFVAHVRDAWGPATILINSAGIYREGFLIDHDEADWCDQIEINLTGAFRMTRAVFTDMQTTGWGRIANIASTAGTKGAAGYAAYCASKAGLIGLTKATAVEGAPHGISCIAVSPTWVETAATPLAISRLAAERQISPTEARASLEASNPQGRLVQPAEVAATVDFFCSPAAPGLTNVDIQINAGADW
jgi:NAD(P)-dependent dehydrogenase (short-subunit alcohol dehydrogenase family)